MATLAGCNDPLPDNLVACGRGEQVAKPTGLQNPRRVASKRRLHLHNGRVLLTILAGSAASLALILLTPLSLWQSIGSAGIAVLCVGFASGLAAFAVLLDNSPKTDASPVLVRVLESTE
jgi:hypothetical protein